MRDNFHVIVAIEFLLLKRLVFSGDWRFMTHGHKSPISYERTIEYR